MTDIERITAAEGACRVGPTQGEVRVRTIVHVNQHVIKSNVKNDKDEPALTIKTYKSNDYAHEAIIYGQDGLEAARVVSAEPLSCGARVYIVTNNEVELLTR